MYFREHMYAFQFDINAGMKLLKHRARELSSTSAAEVTIAKQFSQLLVFICIPQSSVREFQSFYVVRNTKYCLSV